MHEKQQHIYQFKIKLFGKKRIFSQAQETIQENSKRLIKKVLIIFTIFLTVVNT